MSRENYIGVDWENCKYRLIVTFRNTSVAIEMSSWTISPVWKRDSSFLGNCKKCTNMPTFVPKRLAWRPDIPDFRDWSIANSEVNTIFQSIKDSINPPSSVLLDEYFPHEVAAQDEFGSSTAHACVSLIQYFEYRSFGKVVEPSAEFLSRVSSRFDLGSCSVCTSLRSTIMAIQKIGLPPASMLDSPSYQHGSCELDPLLFTFGEPYEAMIYVRLDHDYGQTGTALHHVKSFLSAGFPIVFGFSVPSSLSYDGQIDFRPSFDSIRGGQAAVLTGYDDHRTLATRGAFRIRCSWGTDWGTRGSGWMPYTFLKSGLARDFWVIVRPDWLSSMEFKRPTCINR